MGVRPALWLCILTLYVLPVQRTHSLRLEQRYNDILEEILVEELKKELVEKGNLISDQFAESLL